MKVTATVDRLRREGVDVIDFGAGEPDFGDAGGHQGAAAPRRIDANFTKYTPGRRHRGAAARHLRPLQDRLRRRRTPNPKSSRAPAASRRCSTPRWRCSARATKYHARAVTGRRSPSRSSWPTRRRCSSAHRPTDGFAIRAAADSRRDHAEDARHHHQLAVQSDRRADFRRGAGDARGGSGADAASGWSSISATRS